MYSRKKLSFIFVLLLFISSCSSDKFDVDVSHITIKQDVIRIDTILNNRRNISQLHKRLLREKPNVYRDYYTEVLSLGDPDLFMAHQNLNMFLNDASVMEMQAAIDSAFSDKLVFKDEFESAFKHYRYYFPQDSVPDVVMYNSGYNYGIFPRSTYIGIGLDWYVGNDRYLLSLLPPEQFPKYIKDKMEPEYMVADAVRGWTMVRYNDKIGSKQFLDHIVFFGKIAYIMDALLPDSPGYIKYGYKKEEVLWCQENEFNIWRAIVNEEMLYSTDHKVIKTFIGNAPFTKGFSDRSPGRLAFFIGKMMVKDYMNANEDVEIKDLMGVESTDILKAYRPDK